MIGPENREEFERFLRQLASDVSRDLDSIGEGRVWTKPGPDIDQAFSAPVPIEGQGLEASYADFRQFVLPYLTGNRDPRFWGWVVGSGAPSSMVGDWLAALSNGVPTMFDEANLRTELQVLEWLKQLLGLPRQCGGVLTTGVSEATLIALTVARYAAFGETLKSEGVFRAASTARFYISDQTHDCARKAIAILGFGSNHVRTIPTDSHFRMDLQALEEAIDTDLSAGHKPVAVVATMGTVNTGAFDDVRAIRDLCQRSGIWLHIDAAFGAWTAITKDHAHLADGIELGDSIVFDMHKWMYQIYGLGCVMIRDQEIHIKALEVTADYLAHIDGTLTDAPADLCSRSIQLSRGFRALKFWFSLKAEGAKAFADAITTNIEDAQHLSGLVASCPELELLAPTSLHIVNFRYVGDLRQEEQIDSCNEAILTVLHQEGLAVPSSTRIRGKFSLRVCISNHRTERADLDKFLGHVLRIGREQIANLKTDTERHCQGADNG